MRESPAKQTLELRCVSRELTESGGCILLRSNGPAQTVKRLSTMWETWVPSLGGEEPLEKEMAIHSITIA